ncbi:MAG: DNA polymerase III subunit gamma/tau [Thermodesulfobacteriota bacterium]
MSYLVLARKYRPQTFAEVVQQEHVTRTIANAIAGDRVAHAILFTGPRGTGKTTIARILAKAMNCEKGPTGIPCNDCRSCRAITAGSGADVYEIDGASNNGVDQIRELRENIKYMPAHSRFKIYIIDEVHMLSIPAFNALLKTLEEPPAHILFLMATTEPQKIPVTILSRCQRHDLKRVDAAKIADHMESICRREGVEIERQGLDLIAGQAGGSMRDALSLLDQITSGIAGPATVESILDILGIVDRKSVSEFALATLKGDLDGILNGINQVYVLGRSIPDFYTAVIQYFRDLLVIKMVSAAGRVLDLPQGEIEAMQAVARDASPLHLNQILEVLFNAEKDIRMSNDPRMAFEIVMLRLLQVTPLLPIGDLIDSLDELKSNLGAPSGESRPAMPPTRAAAAPGQPGPGKTIDNEADVRAAAQPAADEGVAAVPEMAMDTEADREETWKRLLDIISEKHPSITPNLANSHIAGFRDGVLEVEVNGSRFNFKRITRQDSMKTLEDVCRTYLGGQVTLSINAGRKQDHQDKGKKKTEIERLKKAVLDHPLVADAIEVFDGKIVDVKIDTK